MYGQRLSADQPYFGPIQPGQTWESYESTQEQLARNLMVGTGLVATAALVNPVVAGIGLLSYLASGAGERQHTNKPRQQGG
jgi:hypothetical protein